MVLLLFIVLVTLHPVVLQTGKRLDYSSETAWPGLCNRGKLQSPIDVNKSLASSMKYPPFTYTEFEKNISYVFKIEGNTLRAKVRVINESPTIGGGPLEVGRYYLYYFDFRWSSEHRMNGQSYPLEMQFLFGPKTSNVNEIHPEQQYCVIAVLYDFNLERREKMHDIIPQLENLSEPEDSADVYLVLGDYIPHESSASYFVYSGSFTTPPCHESVLWVLSEQVASFMDADIEFFKKLSYSKSAKTLLGPNNRKIRTRRNILLRRMASGSSSLSIFLVLHVFVVVMSLFANA